MTRLYARLIEEHGLADVSYAVVRRYWPSGPRRSRRSIAVDACTVAAGALFHAHKALTALPGYSGARRECGCPLVRSE